MTLLYFALEQITVFYQGLGILPPAFALIEKGIITQQEFLQKISEERATYQKLFNPTPH